MIGYNLLIKVGNLSQKKQDRDSSLTHTYRLWQYCSNTADDIKYENHNPSWYFPFFPQVQL
jgi:hypothetical protein